MSLGASGFVTFGIVGPQPIVLIDVDLVGDGQPAPTRIVGQDFRLVRQLGFTPPRAGTFGLEIRALDAAGCWGTSAGQVRNVVVR